ncbi:hypothetical protein EG327_009262 [Venturia inaequalis]|uniref:Uncharacterized protein n=1 Tax=Venturia inaequalis TaxID=5025 RepID=A0A8H3YTG6_VENIN|nr:hypothetical protein EG327_009262 [Venturia inaequalis]
MPSRNPLRRLLNYLSSRRTSKNEAKFTLQNTVANRGKEERGEFLARLDLIDRTYLPQEDILLPRRGKRGPSVGWKEDLEEVVEIEACRVPAHGWRAIKRNDGE